MKNRKLNKADKKILNHLKWIEKIFKEEKTNIFLFGQNGDRLEILWNTTTNREQKIQDMYYNIPITKEVECFYIPCDGGDMDLINERGVSDGI